MSASSTFASSTVLSHPIAVRTNHAVTPAPVTSRKRGLAAHWEMMDGKLVCRWFPVDCEGKFLRI